MAEERLKEYADLHAKAYGYLKDRLGQVASEKALQYGASVFLTEVLRYMKPSEGMERGRGFSNEKAEDASIGLA